MKPCTIILSLVLLLAGCASFEEAYILDREYGQANQASIDRQVMFPGYPHVSKTPVVTEGITAEEIMGVYNDTFAEAPEDIEIFQFELTE